jgi:hypothetical protein
MVAWAAETKVATFRLFMDHRRRLSFLVPLVQVTRSVKMGDLAAE